MSQPDSATSGHLSTINRHVIIVHQDESDDFPYITAECSWAQDDPDRPCKIIECMDCLGDATGECLDHGGFLGEGCGVKAWLNDLGTEGVIVKNMEVQVPVSSCHFDGDGWVLDCATTTERPRSMSATSDDQFHYAVVSCACGFDPGDNLSDREAVDLLRAHLKDHTVVDAVCPQCHVEFVQATFKPGRPAVYCSRVCQVKALHQRLKVNGHA